MSTAILVLAAGRGERLGRSVPKAFVTLLGRTLLERSLETATAASEVARVQPILAAADMGRFAALVLPSIEKLAAPVPGGVRRQDSVAAGLAALPNEIDWVAVHDAARCLVSAEDIDRVISAARTHGAALLATPAVDTIKRVREEEVVETPPRHECWVALTPQVFPAAMLREAIAKARADDFEASDDAQLVERLGVRVRVVEGSPENIKITLPADLALAEQILHARGEAPA